MEWKRIHNQVTGSTNEDAYMLGINGEQTWTVCTADSQTRGKGRLDRDWLSPSGNGLYVSVLIRPSVSNTDTGLLSFCAANAMSKALRRFGPEVMIKWPNDLILHKKKVCGILSSCNFDDGKLNFAVLGAGVNLKEGSYLENLSDRATCLEKEGYKIGADELLEQYMFFLQQEVSGLEANEYESLFEYYLKHSITIGRRVRVTGAVTMEGVAEEIRRDGALLVRDDGNSLRAINSGDVSVRGISGYV